MYKIENYGKNSLDKHIIYGRNVKGEDSTTQWSKN